MTSKNWTLLLALFPIIGIAQTITTYDSRTNGAAIASNYRARDIGVIDRLDVWPWMRSWNAPALIDAQLGIGVTITGTVAQAEADLDAAIAEAWPTLPATLDNDMAAEALGLDEIPRTGDLREVIQAERIRRQTIKDELNLTAEQIDLIRQWAAADVDVLFSGLTAQQRRFLKIQHQLVRALAKRELKEIGEQ
jgi:hypothetical protein